MSFLVSTTSVRDWLATSGDTPSDELATHTILHSNNGFGTTVGDNIVELEACTLWFTTLFIDVSSASRTSGPDKGTQGGRLDVQTIVLFIVMYGRLWLPSPNQDLIHFFVIASTSDQVSYLWFQCYYWLHLSNHGEYNLTGCPWVVQSLFCTSLSDPALNGLGLIPMERISTVLKANSSLNKCINDCYLGSPIISGPFHLFHENQA